MWKSEQLVVKGSCGNAQSVCQWRTLEGTVYMMTVLGNLCAIHRNGDKHGRQTNADSQESERATEVAIHIIDASDE